MTLKSQFQGKEIGSHLRKILGECSDIVTGKPISERDMADVRAALGRRIAALRREEKMSQTEASSRAGLNRRQWVRIEKGEAAPRLDSLLQIQCIFGLDTLEALFGPTTGDLLKVRARARGQKRSST